MLRSATVVSVLLLCAAAPALPWGCGASAPDDSPPFCGERPEVVPLPESTPASAGGPAPAPAPDPAGLAAVRPAPPRRWGVSPGVIAPPGVRPTQPLPEGEVARFEGRVLDDAGRPMAGVRVRAHTGGAGSPHEWVSFEQITGTDGRFAGAADPTTARYRRWHLVAFHPFRAQELTHRLVLREALGRADFRFAAIDTGGLRLRAAAPANPGAQAEPAGYWLSPRAGGPPICLGRNELAISPSPWTELPQIPAGRWTLRVFSPWSRFRTWEGAIDIEAGQWSVLEVLLQPGATLEGTVVDRTTGAAIDGVQVMLAPAACDCDAATHHDVGHPKPVYPARSVVLPGSLPTLCPQTGRVAVPYFTGSDGRFRFPGLDAGGEGEGEVEVAIRYFGREIGRRMLRPGATGLEIEIDGGPALELTPADPERPSALRIRVDGQLPGEMERGGYVPTHYAVPKLQVYALLPGPHVAWVIERRLNALVQPRRGALFAFDVVAGGVHRREPDLQPLGVARYWVTDAVTGAAIAAPRVELLWEGRRFYDAAGNKSGGIELSVPTAPAVQVRISAKGYRADTRIAVPLEFTTRTQVAVRLQPQR